MGILQTKTDLCAYLKSHGWEKSYWGSPSNRGRQEALFYELAFNARGWVGYTTTIFVWYYPVGFKGYVYPQHPQHPDRGGSIRIFDEDTSWHDVDDFFDIYDEMDIELAIKTFLKKHKMRRIG